MAVLVALPVAGCATDGNVIPDTRSKLVAYSGDNFTVAMPDKPRESTQRLSTPAGEVTEHVLTVDQGFERSYAVAYIDYASGTQLNLDGAVQGAADKTGGHAVDIKRIIYRHVEGRDFRIVIAPTVVGTDEGTFFARILVVGRRLYSLLVAVPESGATSPPADFAPMLRSFRFRAPNAAGRGTTPSPATTEVDFAQVKAGDCYNNPPGDPVYTLPELPCQQPHDGQVFFVFTMPTGKYPGDDAVDASAEHTCGDRFARIRRHLTGPFDYAYFTPARDAWKARDRSTQCAVIRTDGQKLHERLPIR